MSSSAISTKALLTLLLVFSACSPRTLSTDVAWWEGSVKSIKPTSPSSNPSRYLTMRDGTKLATDVYLPEGSGPFPTVFWQTRYYRDFDIRFPFFFFHESLHQTSKQLLGAGYALVAVDVRGSGASFGSQQCPWSPEEVSDAVEVVEWITKQPWSDGTIGVTGVSYSGTSAEMLATRKHPAVRALIPRFSLFDCYSEIAFPGGLYNEWFMKSWAAGNKLLDDGRPDFGGLVSFWAVRGPKPVDEDPERVEIYVASREHSTNANPYKDTEKLTYRDDVVWNGLTFQQFCPHGFLEELRESKLPIYSYSGWWDGAYALSAIRRFRSIQNPGSRLVLGPWDHGGRQNISPMSPERRSGFDHGTELVRFLDQHVRGLRSSITHEAPVHYFTMGEERWKSSDVWPPRNLSSEQLYLSPGAKLTKKAVAGPSESYNVRFDASSGESSRWNSPYNPGQEEISYPDRAEEDRKLLVYDSEPLAEDKEVTGHPVLNLNLSSSSTDGGLFVYLEEVTPDGRVQYVTEGLQRLLHRKVSESSLFSNVNPVPSYLKQDGKLMSPGVSSPVSVELLPTSYLFRKGSRIRIAIAGADKDHFRVPSTEPLTYTIAHGGAAPSHIVLPVALR